MESREEGGLNGMVRVEIVNVLVSENNFLVLLKEIEGTGRVFPISIGVFEANGIVMALEGITTRRPLTYDIMKTIMTTSGLVIEKLVISDLRDNIFYGTLYVNDGKSVVQYDVRPSDGIALSVRFNSPIFVAQKVFDALELEGGTESYFEQGADDKEMDLEQGEEKEEWNQYSLSGEEGTLEKESGFSGDLIQERIDYLENQLSQAVEEERYEDAAKLRDEIQKLKNTLGNQ